MPWWMKTVAINRLSPTLKDISASARERRWKSGRRGGGRGGDRDTEESEDEAGSDGSWGARMDIGDAQVGE